MIKVRETRHVICRMLCEAVERAFQKFFASNFILHWHANHTDDGLAR